MHLDGRRPHREECTYMGKKADKVERAWEPQRPNLADCAGRTEGGGGGREGPLNRMQCGKIGTPVQASKRASVAGTPQEGAGRGGRRSNAKRVGRKCKQMPAQPGEQ